MDKKISIYIARDSNYKNQKMRNKTNGELHLFYDTPRLVRNLGMNEDKKRKGKYIWAYARMIGSVPSYMYPELLEGQCLKLEADVTPLDYTSILDKNH